MSQIPLNPDGGRAEHRMGIKVSDRQRELLEDAAGTRHVTMSAVVREAIDRMLGDLETTGPPGRKAAA